MKKENKKMRKSNLYLTLLVEMITTIFAKIDGKPFSVFTRNTFIGNMGASCYIINNNYGIFDVETIKESEHEKSGAMKTT